MTSLIPVFDTLSSRGGMSDLRVAGSFRARERSVLGASFHILTGTNRMEQHRTFTDDQYLPVEQSTELSFAGVGASIGAVQQLGRSLWVAAIARSDGGASVERDSAAVGDIDLPYSAGTGPAMEGRRQARPGGPWDLSNLVRRQQRPPGPRGQRLGQHGRSGVRRRVPERSPATEPRLRSASARTTRRSRSSCPRASSRASSALRWGRVCGSPRTVPAWTWRSDTSRARPGTSRSAASRSRSVWRSGRDPGLPGLGSRPLSSAHDPTGVHRDVRLPDERERLRADARAPRPRGLHPHRGAGGGATSSWSTPAPSATTRSSG